MDTVENIVIIGAGIAGLSTALGLHRMGIKSLVLESSERLRVTGYAFLTWTNAWKALDALGIGEFLRHQHLLLERIAVFSLATGLITSQASFSASGQCHEVRCVKRRLLLDTLVQELPQGTIRFGSKVVSLEQSGNLQLVHLADGSTLKTKVLLGCDGVNSVVSKWVGLSKPSYAGRSAIRGLIEFPHGHGLKLEFSEYIGNGFKFGFIPCDEKSVFWFSTYPSSPANIEETPLEMKQFLLSRLGMVPERVRAVVENTELDCFVSAPLRFRRPWELVWANCCKEGVTVAGDALHPMTPDLGQGACSALEDGITLARCIAEAFTPERSEEGDEGLRIRKALKKYANERRWRGINLITTAYVIGWIQQRDGRVMNFVTDKLSKFLAEAVLKKADFDPGKLCKD